MTAGGQEIEIKRRSDGIRYVQPYLGRSRVTGRMIRPYKSFPASMTDEEVEEAVWLINNRPRKVLGWRLPSEVMRDVLAEGAMTA